MHPDPVPNMPPRAAEQDDLILKRFITQTYRLRE